MHPWVSRWGFLAMGVRREKALWAPPPYLLPGGLLGPPQPPTASCPERHVGPSGSRVEVAPGTTDPGEKVNKGKNKRMGTKRKGGGKQEGDNVPRRHASPSRANCPQPEAPGGPSCCPSRWALGIQPRPWAGAPKPRLPSSGPGCSSKGRCQTASCPKA